MGFVLQASIGDMGHKHHICENHHTYSDSPILIWLVFSSPSEMKLHEPKPSGLMANPAFANVVNMNLNKSGLYYKYESYQIWQILQIWILANLTNITNVNLNKSDKSYKYESKQI